MQCWLKCKIGYVLFTVLGLYFCISFPAYSSSFITNTSLGEIGSAFILGFSFPIIFLSLCGQFNDKYRLVFFLLSTISLLAIVYFIAFSETLNWDYFLFVSVIYLVSLLFSCSLKRDKSLFNLIMLIPFVMSALYFSVAVLLWSNNQIDKQWLLVNSIGSYVVFIFTSCLLIFKVCNYLESNNELNNKKRRGTSSRDSTTNLPSQKKALQCINKVLEHEPKISLAIIVFKPVNFQQMNKVLGYKNSDILLLQLTYSLQKRIEHHEQLINFNLASSPVRLAHLRGLHFVSVLQLKEGETNRDMFVENLCKELTQGIPDAMSFKSFSLNFELTFGVSFINKGINDNLSQCISHAEDALLIAESNNQLINYFNKDEILYTGSYLVQMEQLKQDIIDDNLHWYVQPQSSLINKQLIGFELLVEWRNDKGEPVESKGFINTAEHSGEIYLLTKQMIIKAFKLILKLQRVSSYQTVSLKLLSHKLFEPDLVSFIERQIVTYNVSAKYLVIELPESAVSLIGDKAKVFIDELRALKVRIAISNFSGSYESLRYMRKMAIDQIKVDCEHINDAANETENVIVTSLLELTKKMELPLIGTSINTKSAEQAFTLIGGELAQGNVVDKGVDFDSIDSWISAWNKLYSPI